eukprot:scaffold111975_cov63-Phaeocystis_antarctica.AAC.2
MPPAAVRLGGRRVRAALWQVLRSRARRTAAAAARTSLASDCASQPELWGWTGPGSGIITTFSVPATGSSAHPGLISHASASAVSKELIGAPESTLSAVGVSILWAPSERAGPAWAVNHPSVFGPAGGSCTSSSGAPTRPPTNPLARPMRSVSRSASRSASIRWIWSMIPETPERRIGSPMGSTSAVSTSDQSISLYDVPRPLESIEPEPGHCSRAACHRRHAVASPPIRSSTASVSRAAVMTKAAVACCGSSDSSDRSCSSGRSQSVLLALHIAMFFFAGASKISSRQRVKPVVAEIAAPRHWLVPLWATLHSKVVIEKTI